MNEQKFTVKLAETEQELASAMKLRLEMLVEYNPKKAELTSDLSDWDKDAKHLIVKDNNTNEVIGYYRMIISKHCNERDRFVCESEFDIAPIKKTGLRLCEFSRAVVKKEYRNGSTLILLWRFILDYVLKNDCRYLIGDVSFPGTDREQYIEQISYVANHFVIDKFDVRSKDMLPPMQLLDETQYDAKTVKRSLPALVKAYTSFGGKLSTQTFIDKEFGSVDLFVLLDTTEFNWSYVNRLVGIGQ